MENLRLDYLFCIFAVTVFSMVLHELAHGLVAYWQGDATAKEDGRLSLNPLRHIDPMMTVVVPLILAILGMPIFGGAKPVPVNKYRMKHGNLSMALVALAGPVTNIILAFLFFMIGHWTGVLTVSGGEYYLVNNFWGTLIWRGVIVNLGFALFNLIPIPPLDGSRVLYVLMPDGVRDFMDTIERFGVMVVYVLIGIFGSALSSYMITGENLILSLFSLLT